MTLPNKKVLMVTYSTPDKLARLARTVEILKSDGYTIDVLSNDEVKHTSVDNSYKFDKPGMSMCDRILRKISRVLRLIPNDKIRHRLTDFGLKHNSQLISIAKKYDIVLVEHIDFLRPILLNKNSSTKVIFDIRDYYPREFELESGFNIFERPYRTLVFRDYISRVDAVISVSPGLRDLLLSEYSVNSMVVRNTPYFSDMKPMPVRSAIKCVHHGTTHSDRGIKEMVQCDGFSDDIPLYLYVVDVYGALAKIKDLSKTKKFIHFPDLVPLSKLISVLNSHDVMIIFFPGDTVNNQYGLPNKIFEAVQANLMIITTPLPDMKYLVEKYDLGIVLPSFSLIDLTKVLHILTPEIVDHHKRMAHIAAKELCFETEREKLSAVFKSVMV